MNLIITQTHNSRLVKRKHVALRGSRKMGGAAPTFADEETEAQGCSNSAKVLAHMDQKAGIQTQIWAQSTPACYHPGQTHWKSQE